MKDELEVNFTRYSETDIENLKQSEYLFNGNTLLTCRDSILDTINVLDKVEKKESDREEGESMQRRETLNQIIELLFDAAVLLDIEVKRSIVKSLD